MNSPCSGAYRRSLEERRSFWAGAKEGDNPLSENMPDKTMINNPSERRSLNMATITKKKLIQNISQIRGLHPNDVRNVIQAFLDAMTDTLSQGDRLEFRDFGVFEVV